MEIAGHIGRRKQHGEGRPVSARRRRSNFKELLFDPVLGPPRLDRAWIVSLGQLVRHESKPMKAAKLNDSMRTEGSQGLLTEARGKVGVVRRRDARHKAFPRAQKKHSFSVENPGTFL